MFFVSYIINLVYVKVREAYNLFLLKDQNLQFFYLLLEIVSAKIKVRDEGPPEKAERSLKDASKECNGENQLVVCIHIHRWINNFLNHGREKERNHCHGANSYLP